MEAVEVDFGLVNMRSMPVSVASGTGWPFAAAMAAESRNMRRISSCPPARMIWPMLPRIITVSAASEPSMTSLAHI